MDEQGAHTITQRFVPRPLIEMLRNQGRTETLTGDVDACVASVDVSLFSAFADRIERAGRGAERLGATMRAVLNPAIESIESSGGSIVSFGGDSLTAMWPSEGAGISAINAAAAVVAISEHSERSETGLRLRTGLSAGRVRVLDLACSSDRRFLLPTGDPVTKAVHIQEAALMGTVAVSPEFVALDPPGCEFFGRAGESQILVACHEQPAPVAPSAALFDGSDRYVAFDPTELTTEEIRPISALYVRVGGVGAHAEALVNVIDEVLSLAGSRLHQVAITGDTLTALSYFGLPGGAHRDDADRAVNAALALEMALADGHSQFGIGVGSGRTFCGPFGTDETGIYAVLGTALNRAARLSTVAESSVAVDANTREAASTFRYSREQAHRVRGLGEPLSSYRPIQTPTTTPNRNADSRPVLLGRNEELERVSHQLGVASAGTATAVVIEGVSGVGKTALLTEIEAAARREEMLVTVTKCNERDRVKPYASLRPVLRDLAGLDPAGSSAQHHERLSERFGAIVEDPGWMSLLNEPLGVAFPRTARTKEMTSSDRQEVLQSLLLSLFEAVAKPRAVIIDDAHWLDRSSWALVRVALARARNLVVIIAAQSEYADNDVADLRRAIEAEGPNAVAGRSIRLQPLGASEVATLAASELGATSVPQQLSDYLREMTSGHPLLIIELTRALHSRGVLRVEDSNVEIVEPAELSSVNSAARLSSSDDIPIRIQQLITARLDRLGSPDRRALQTAARLFRGDFSIDELAAVMELGESGAGELLERLAGLEDLGILRQRTQRRWDFDHRMTRIAAAGLASDEHEEILHRRLVDWLEREPEPDYNRLAFHTLRAGDVNKAVDYLDAAGSVALLGGAPLEARELFESLLALVDRDDHPADASRTRRAHWEIQLAEAHSAAGNRSESELRFRSALAHLGSPLPTGPGVALRLAFEALRQLLHRLGWLRFRPVERPSEDALALAQASRAAGLLAQVFYFEERLTAWFMTVLISVNLSERINDPGVAALGYSGLASVTGILQTLPGMGSLSSTVEFYLRQAHAETITNVYPGSVAGVVDEMRPAEDSHHRATADVAASVYRLSIERRPAGGASAAIADAENGVRLARGLGGFDAIAAALAVYSFAHLIGGRQDVASKAIDELGAIADRSRNMQYLAWHAMLKVPIAHSMEDHADMREAADRLEDHELYVGADGVSQGVMRAGRLLASMSGSDTVTGQRLDELLPMANDALRHLGASPVFLNFIGHDMLLSSLEIMHAGAPLEERRRIDRVRRRALARLNRYRRRQPFADALFALHRGISFEQGERAQRAERHFTEAVEESTESELTFIRGRALARLAETTTGERAEAYRAQARAELMESGATHYLE